MLRLLRRDCTDVVSGTLSPPIGSAGARGRLLLSGDWSPYWLLLAVGWPVGLGGALPAPPAWAVGVVTVTARAMSHP